MTRYRSHRGDGEQRIIGRDLQTFAQRLIGTAAVNVKNAQCVGDEKAIEFSPLQCLGQLNPKRQLPVSMRLAAWVPPQTGCGMSDCGALEAVKANAAISHCQNSRR
jgi:hypothetical protein